jgi:hypothetical protein
MLTRCSAALHRVVLRRAVPCYSDLHRRHVLMMLMCTFLAIHH